MMSELNQTDLQLIETESMLDVKRDVYKVRQEAISSSNEQLMGNGLL